MSVHNLFPIPVVEYVLNEKITEQELEFVAKERLNATRNISNWTSADKYILERPEFSRIKCELLRYVNEYFNNVFRTHLNLKIEMYITNSWLNWNEVGDSHHPHCHANSLVSGVLYLDVCDNTDSIEIENPNKLLGNITVGGIGTSQWYEPGRAIPAHTNHLLLFPSVLKHAVSVRRIPITKPRISLSFNTWFKGTMGADTLLTTLTL